MGSQDSVPRGALLAASHALSVARRKGQYVRGHPLRMVCGSSDHSRTRLGADNRSGFASLTPQYALLESGLPVIEVRNQCFNQKEIDDHVQENTCPR
mgnify:CR=1 FL=1